MLNCPKCGTALVLETSLKLESAESMSNPPKQPGLPGWPQPPREPSSAIGALLMRIDESVLEDAEQQFVRETRERFRKYGEGVRITEKQLAWLKRLAAKSAACENSA